MNRAYWVAAGLMAAAMIAPAAQAASYTFDGSTSGGVDPLGGNYAFGTDNVGFTAFSETADQQADNTQDVTFRGGQGVTAATSFTLTETAGVDPIFNGGFDVFFFQDTPNGQVDWNIASQGDTSVTFTAPEGLSLQSGDMFSVNVALSGDAPSNFGYAVTWSDGVSAAPEPSTWALMILGIGAVGVALRQAHAGRRRFGFRAS